MCCSPWYYYTSSSSSSVVGSSRVAERRVERDVKRRRHGEKGGVEKARETDKAGAREARAYAAVQCSCRTMTAELSRPWIARDGADFSRG